MRLDQHLVMRGYFDSRARASAAIKAGHVLIGGAPAHKPSQTIAGEADIEIVGEGHGFVSRGAMKLLAALEVFAIDPSGKACLDIGASTGGFTQVLLQGGATKVYAVDVGHGQLHPSLQSEPGVIALEKTNAKALSRTLIPDPVDLIVCDVSFISLKKALPAALALAAPGAQLAVLVKPQFEVGPARIGKGGIVKPGRENAEGVADDMICWINEQPGWRAMDFIESPIRGGDGNREFLIGSVRDA